MFLPRFRYNYSLGIEIGPCFVFMTNMNSPKTRISKGYLGWYIIHKDDTLFILLVSPESQTTWFQLKTFPLGRVSSYDQRYILDYFHASIKSLEQGVIVDVVFCNITIFVIVMMIQANDYPNWKPSYQWQVILQCLLITMVIDIILLYHVYGPKEK